jgi:hypothetical protein
VAGIGGVTSPMEANLERPNAVSAPEGIYMNICDFMYVSYKGVYDDDDVHSK